MDIESTGIELEAAGAEPAHAQEAPAWAAHGLMAVLMPANPPQPKNARVIRLFDAEPGKDESRPGEIPMREARPAREPSARDAAKAARKSSLYAAAGLG